MVFSDFRLSMLFLEIKQTLLILILRAGHLIIGFWILKCYFYTIIAFKTKIFFASSKYV